MCLHDKIYSYVFASLDYTRHSIIVIVIISTELPMPLPLKLPLKSVYGSLLPVHTPFQKHAAFWDYYLFVNHVDTPIYCTQFLCPFRKIFDLLLESSFVKISWKISWPCRAAVLCETFMAPLCYSCSLCYFLWILTLTFTHTVQFFFLPVCPFDAYGSVNDEISWTLSKLSRFN